MRELSTSTPATPAVQPAPHRELTARAVAIAMLVAALMGAAEPTVVLRIGYGPNMSVVSAFLGFIAHLRHRASSPADAAPASRTTWCRPPAPRPAQASASWPWCSPRSTC